jgi:hypothetical protein
MLQVVGVVTITKWHHLIIVKVMATAVAVAVAVAVVVEVVQAVGNCRSPLPPLPLPPPPHLPRLPASPGCSLGVKAQSET